MSQIKRVYIMYTLWANHRQRLNETLGLCVVKDDRGSNVFVLPCSIQAILISGFANQLFSVDKMYARQCSNLITVNAVNHVQRKTTYYRRQPFV